MLGEPLRRGLSARGPEDYTLSQDAPSAGRPTSTQQTSQHTSDDMLALVLNSLDDDKAEEVVSIDLRGRTAIADHMVIASGRSSRQVGAIAEKLAERVKQVTGRSPRIEGKDAGDWVLIDTDDVIVHVFRPRSATSISWKRCGCPPMRWPACANPPNRPAISRRTDPPRCGSTSPPWGG